MLCSFLVETICLLFTIWLTRLLLVRVDWPKLLTMNCDEEIENVNTCQSHLGDYARTDPLSWPSYLLIQGYTFLLLAYALFKSWVFYQDFFGHAIQCRTILHDKLGLSERKLQGGALSWNEVVKKLAEGQESGTYKIIQHHTAAAHHFNSHAHSNGHNDHSPLNPVPEMENDREQMMNGESDPEQPTPTPVSKGGAGRPPAAPPSAPGPA